MIGIKNGNANTTKKSKKFDLMKQRKKAQMKSLSEGTTDLHTYLKSMGFLTLKYDKRSRQKGRTDEPLPLINSNESVVPPSENSVNFNRQSLSGEERRQQRLADDYTVNFSQSIIDPSLISQPTYNVPLEGKLTLDQGACFAAQRLEETGFKLSKTQDYTERSGNCFPHACEDQLKYDSLLKNLGWKKDFIRTKVVADSEEIVLTHGMIWECNEGPNGEPMSKYDWKIEMDKTGSYVDTMFLQIFANIVKRRLVLVPVFKSSAHDNVTGLTEIIPLLEAGLPMYYLYYSDQKFLNGHYQSIRPSHESSPRCEIRSVPEDENNMSIPCYESSKLPNVSEELVFESVSSQPKRSRVNLRVDESNIISDSKRRRRR